MIMHPNPDAQIEPLSVWIAVTYGRLRRALRRAYRAVRAALVHAWGWVRWQVFYRRAARTTMDLYEANRKRAAKRRA